MFFTAKTSAIGRLRANWKTRNALLFTALLWLCSWSHGAAVLDIGEVGQRSPLINSLDILADPDRNLSFEQVSRAPLSYRFRPIVRGDLALDFHEANYWLRFTLHNSAGNAQSPVLKILPPYIHDARIYIVGETGHAERLNPPGLLIPPLLFELQLPPNTSRTYYLHLADTRRLQIATELQAWPQLINDHRINVFVNGITIGGLLILAAFNLGIGAKQRSSANLWLALYCSCVLLAMFSVWGVFSIHPMDNELGSALFGALILLALAATHRFAMAFGIAPRSSAPLSHLYMRSVFVLILVLAALSLFVETQHVYSLIAVAIVFSAIGQVAIPLLTFFATQDRLLLYYLATRLWVIAVDSFAVVAFSSELSSIENINAVLIGSTCLEAIALSGLLIARYERRNSRRQQEQQFLTLAETESRAHSELLNEIMHRLRSPMSVLMGNLEMLRNTQLSATQSDYMDAVNRATEQLMTEFDEISAQRMRAQTVPQSAASMFDARQLLSDCQQDCAQLANQFGSELQLIIDDDVPKRILGHPARIKQMLLHLINAAFDRGAGQAITLHAANQPSRNELRFDLDYSGRELTQMELALLQNPNHPAGENAQHSLRLAIVRHLADSMGATLQACNTPGGASIALTLPYHYHDNPARNDDGNTSLHGKHLLLIDDNPEFTKMLNRQAQHWGMQCFTASNENQATAIVRNQLLLRSPIEAIIVDGHLTHTPPAQVLSRILQEIRDAGLPAPTALLLTEDTQSNLPPGQFDQVLAKHNCIYLLRGILERGGQTRAV